LYQFHGWVVISGGSHAGGTQRERNAVTLVTPLLAPLNVDRRSRAEINVRNGRHWLSLEGSVDHAHAMPAQIQAVLQLIAIEAPSSYGQLLERDDEADHLPADRNSFRLTLIRRGRITRHRDTHFSPIVPTIED
jgi:hypothetical protein